MTSESSPKLERRFVRDGLPWVVGAAALAVYLATLNHGVTLSNLALVTRVSGWDWQPMLTQPLLCLLTYPFRWLPAGWVPLALNIFTAVCASLTLATLARSVALLPHDRLEQQRLLVQNEHALLSLPGAWVPVALAAVALGLQLTFWESAIAASGEMLDLLLFAYIIRCLLEHRLHQQQLWLDRAALLFGCAMANNWGMFGFLPLFVVALLRTKKLSFFRPRAIRRLDESGWESARIALRVDLRFFLRVTLLGLAGLSLFLLLPLLQWLSPHSSVGFWQALHAVVSSDKEVLHSIGRWLLTLHRELALLLAAASLLPILLLSIRWGAFNSADRHRRFDLLPLILFISHAFLLLICLWAVFDPPFAPRQIARQTGLALSFLPLYYFTALSIGYYSGFFLLLFSSAALQGTSSRAIIRPILCRVVPKLVYVLLGLALAGLLLLNLPAIRAFNSPHFARYARLAAEPLPPAGAVVYSDDLVRLAFLDAALAREGKAKRYLPLAARQLPSASYRDWLSRKFRGQWPAVPRQVKAAGAGPALSLNAPLDAAGIAQLLTTVVQSNRVYCLQPGFGRLLEQFYLQPHGLVQELKFYPSELLSDPPLTSAELAENQAFWQSAIETEIKPVLQLASLAELPRSAFAKRLMKEAHLQTLPPAHFKVLAAWYSTALNRWGVTLQRNDRLQAAASCFALACDLNADNLSARINQQCNSNLLAHQGMTIVRKDFILEQSAKYRNWNDVLAENGPIDDPSYCFNFGTSLPAAGLPRQACQYLERVKALVPEDVSVRLALGGLYSTGLNPSRAIEIAAEIRADPALRPRGLTNEVEVALLEARGYLAMTNRLMAQAIVNALLFAHPGDAFVAERAASTYAAYRDYSDALRVIDRQLQLNQKDLLVLLSKGNVCVLAGDYSNAIPPLTLALSLTNSFGGRRARAVAYQRTGRFDEAQADYQQLLSAFPDNYRIYWELAEVALQKKDTNTAIRYYEQFLAKSEPDTDETRAVVARLKSAQQSR